MSDVPEKIVQLEADVLAHWSALKGRLVGMLAPDAQALVRDEFGQWLNTIDVERPTVICDWTNNPPSLEAQGKLEALILVTLGGQRWYWTLTV